MNIGRAIAILILAALAGFVGYELGIMQNVAAQIPAGTAPAMPAYYGYPYHWGWGIGVGIFGFFFWLFVIFLFFGLLRAAFGGGRGWGHRHGPWSVEGRAHIEELHRELHGEKPSAPRDGGTSATP